MKSSGQQHPHHAQIAKAASVFFLSRLLSTNGVARSFACSPQSRAAASSGEVQCPVFSGLFCLTHWLSVLQDHEGVVVCAPWFVSDKHQAYSTLLMAWAGMRKPFPPSSSL